MLTLRGIITLLVLAVLFALAVVWISKNGGWKGEGCGGNCASALPQPLRKPGAQKAVTLKAPPSALIYAPIPDNRNGGIFMK